MGLVTLKALVITGAVLQVGLLRLLCPLCLLLSLPPSPLPLLRRTS